MREITSQIYSSARISKRIRQLKEILSKSVPVAVFSVRDGILMATQNRHIESPKIFRIHNRTAVAAIGNYEDIQELRKRLITDALAVEMMYSPKDANAEIISDGLSSLLKNNLYDLWTKPLELELAVSQVDERQDNDQIFHVNFGGRIIRSKFIVVGGYNIDKDKAENKTEISKVFEELKSQYSPDWDSKDALGHILEQNNSAIEQSYPWEIKLLSRGKLGEGEEFEDVLTILK